MWTIRNNNIHVPSLHVIQLNLRKVNAFRDIILYISIEVKIINSSFLGGFPLIPSLRTVYLHACIYTCTCTFRKSVYMYMFVYTCMCGKPVQDLSRPQYYLFAFSGQDTVPPVLPCLC